MYVCVVRDYCYTIKVPEVYEKLVRQNNNQWEKIADQQREKLFSPSPDDLQQQAKRLLLRMCVCVCVCVCLCVRAECVGVQVCMYVDTCGCVSPLYCALIYSIEKCC